MNAGDGIVLCLVLLADLVAALSSIGVIAMRDPLQRLHYIAPAATLSTALLTAAVAVGTRSTQATLKMAAVGLLLLAVNGVVAHATARAVRLRDAKLATDSAPEAGG